MDLEQIRSKLNAEEKALSDLENKRKKLDERILKRKKKITDLNNLIQSKQYSDIDSQLNTLGLSREELLDALKNNDLLALQELIETQNQSNIEENLTDFN